MEFTRKQVLNFSNNWKKFHEEGKHKPYPKVISSGFPPGHAYYFESQTHMVSDLKFYHYIMYNYLRNLPIDRGQQKHKHSFRYNLEGLKYHLSRVIFQSDKADLPEYSRMYNYYMKEFESIFGPEFNIDIIKGIVSDIESYKY